MSHVPNFAREPHPSGSEALERARDYLVAQLNAWGVETQVQKAAVIRGHSITYVENVLGRIPGTNSGGAFVLTAHYDSVYSGPGAADDGAGVITMLETARALMAAPRLPNDVILVFTGDEELGRKGIIAFTEHRWARDVAAMLGLEARGTHGPSYMFETSPRNSWLIRQLRQADVQPRGSSLMRDVHRRMPTTTDYDRLIEQGFPGYNVAFVGGLAYYHSANDRLENLSPASVQHHGAYALGLARHFGNLAAAESRKARLADADSVYFNVLGSWLVAYPANYGRLISCLAGTAFAAAVIVGFVRRRLRFRDMALGAMALFGAVAASLAVTGGLLWLVYRAHGVYILYRETLYVAGFAFLALAASAAVWLAVPRKFEASALQAGALVWLAAVLGFLEWWAPLGSYFAAWPLMTTSLGMTASFCVWRTELSSAVRLSLMTFFALPGLLFLGPGFQSVVHLGSVFVAPLCLVVAILLGATVLPQLMFALSRARWWFPAINVSVGLVLVGVAWSSNSLSPSQPRENGVCYALDLDSRKASWASGDKSLDSWTAQFFKSSTKGTLEEFFPGWQTPYLKAEAPIVDIPGPQVETLEDAVVSGTRKTRLRITSPRKVPEMEVTIFGPERVWSVAVDGREISGAGGKLTLRFDVFPRSGSVELALETTPGGVLGVRIKETSYSLADAPSFRPRAPNMIRRPNTLDWFEGNKLKGDFMFITRTFRLGPLGGNSS
jgi:hypothetical protein